MPTRPLSPDGPFGRFADHLLRVELPELPGDRRDATVTFTCRRAQEVPTPLRVGIVALTLGVGLAGRVVGDERLGSWLRRTQLPFVAELARMIRSLGFTYVWETWPSTSPLGAPERSA